MAQQQPRREEFGNAPRTFDDRDRNQDPRKNDEFGTRTATDPVAPYAYGTTGGYGTQQGGMGDYGNTEYTYTAAYGTTGTAPGYGVTSGPGMGGTATTGLGTTGEGGQWGRDANTDRGGGDVGRNKTRGRD